MRLEPDWPAFNWNIPDREPKFKETVDPTFQASVNRLGWFVLPKYEDDDDDVSAKAISFGMQTVIFVLLDSSEGNGNRDKDATSNTGATGNVPGNIYEADEEDIKKALALSIQE